MKLNNLSGKTWAKLTQNVWITRKLLHWSARSTLCLDSTFIIKQKAMKTEIVIDRPLDEARVKLIELFTQKNQCVFDPDLQYGDTLKAAVHLGCQFVGVAKTQGACEDALTSLADEALSQTVTLLSEERHQYPLNLIKSNSVDFLLTELPHFDFKNQKEDYQPCLIKLVENLKAYREKLKPKAYMALIVSDQRYQDQYYSCHSDVIEAIKHSGFKLHGLINVIQDRNALKAYGYPSTYVPNIINQYVVIARK